MNYRKAARGARCTNCGAEDDTVILAHYSGFRQHQFGKGRGIKADDNLVAALCMHCHHDIDQGSKWSKRERQQAWWLAHINTVDLLLATNQWPVDVPLPDRREWERLFSQ